MANNCQSFVIFQNKLPTEQRVLFHKVLLLGLASFLGSFLRMSMSLSLEFYFTHSMSLRSLFSDSEQLSCRVLQSCKLSARFVCSSFPLSGCRVLPVILSIIEMTAVLRDLRRFYVIFLLSRTCSGNIFLKVNTHVHHVTNEPIDCWDDTSASNYFVYGV